MVRRVLRGSKATRMLFAKKITRDTESVFALEEKKKKRKEKEEKGGTSFSSLVREFF